MTPLLEVDNLSISFGSLDIVRGVSFTITSGQTLALVGESGCGKSVTAQAIMRLFRSQAMSIKSGRILFLGKDLVQESTSSMQALRGKEISFIQQNPQSSLNPTLQIGRQLLECIKPGLYRTKKEQQEAAFEVLSLVGISDVKSRFLSYPGELSGGMKQRVLIAMAIINKPKLLIADEPTTALDVTIQAQILDLLLDLQDKIGTSILFISHDMGVVARIAHRVAVMYAGSIVEIGEINKIFYTPQHPYTLMLLSCLTSYQGIVGAPPLPGQFQGICPFASRCPKAMKICIEQPPPLCKHDAEHFSSCWKNR